MLTPPSVFSGSTASAIGSSPLWEWNNDSSGWTAYDAQTCSLLETAHSAGTNVLDLTHSFFGQQGGYVVDFTKMTQLKKSTGFERPIRRTDPTGTVSSGATPKSKKRRAQTMTPTPAAPSTATSSAPSTSIVWEWQDDAGFVAYDGQTCGLLEAAHAAAQSRLDLNHGYFGAQGGYFVDLLNMTQTKKASGYARSIRRVDPNAPSASVPPMKRPKAASTAPAPIAVSPVAPQLVAPAPVVPAVSASTDSASTGSAPSTPATPTGPVWEYSIGDDDDTWAAFDRITIRLIEGAVTTGRSSTTLNHGTFVAKGGCFLDFGTMEMRENKAGTILKLRRTPPLAVQIKSPKLDHSGGSGGSATASPATGGKKKNAKKTAAAVLTPEETALKKLTAWKEVADKEIEEKDNCPVCLCSLKDTDASDPSTTVVRLGKCTGHFFHRGCVLLCYQHSKNQFVRCPICTTIYGIQTGPQPKGTMTHSKNSSSLSGYPKCGTITINYSFPNGTQGPEHPHPGVAYTGTSRTAYLPDNAEGNEVLRLLKISFDRRLTFRIGQSVTTGADDQVVWNGVHHKTCAFICFIHIYSSPVSNNICCSSTSGGSSGFGYPDATYLERVTDELAQKGVE